MIEQDDILAFGERMCAYTGWGKDSIEKRRMLDILETFYECVRDQVKAEYLSKYKCQISLNYSCSKIILVRCIPMHAVIYFSINVR